MHRLTYILILFLTIAQVARPDEYRSKVSLSWDDPVSEPELSETGIDQWLLNFQGAIYHKDCGWLPIYCRQFPLDHRDFTVKISVEDAIFESLELPDVEEKILDYKLVTNELVTFHEIVYQRKKPYLSVYLVPLRYVQGTFQLEKLISCNLGIDIDYSPDPGPRQSPVTHTENSVLSTGDWYKVSVSRSGIHKIDYEDLESYGIDPESINPQYISIYGNGGSMLPESTAQLRPDDLLENAIRVIGEEDGYFDESDYILFYAEGPVRWTYNTIYKIYEHDINLYTDRIYYFLHIGDSPGKRVEMEPAIDEIPDKVISTTDVFQYHENDSVNLIKSGKEWYGEVYHDKTSYDYVFTFPNLILDSHIYLKSNLVARSTEVSHFTISLGDQYLEEQEIGSVQPGSSIYARTMTTRIIECMPGGNELRFTIDYDKPNSTATGWLNYIHVSGKSNLVFSGGQRSFRNIESVGMGFIAQFNITTQLSNIRVWDVTEPDACHAEEVFAENDGYAIRVFANELREYIVFDETDFYRPEFVKKVENQNLHGLSPANLVIIVHPPFMAEALRLADFHRQHSHLSVNVVTPDEIYNEFSSGAPDITGIRDFLKMIYDRNDNESELRYLLLFGDASYDYKDRIPEDNNLVPTFQSTESLKLASSFVTDDYYGCLDYGEGSNSSGTVDIGIGRFPVRTLEEATIVVDKVIHYATSSREVTQPWRNTVWLVADDEDNNIHLKQAEDLSEIMDTTAFGFNVNKIYLDSYLQQSSPVGYRYPEASEAINNAVLHGSLIVNYTGHGGETGWAAERVLDMPMIMGWDNYDRLPAFVTATCEFSRFDDPGLVSAGEWVLLNPRGGGIGLFTTTRLAYSQSNAALNRRLYQAAFQRDDITGKYPRMGDLMRAAKTPSSQNINNFVLLGDPALMLAYPYQQVVTTEINNVYSGKNTDTLQALSHVSITGQIEDFEGNLLENFHGKVYPTVFDKPVTYQTRANDASSKVTDFLIQNKVLYKGEVTVTAGQFSYSFIVPKDISYQFGLGKISYYAVDTTTFIDAQGYEEVFVGGADDLSVQDDQGPVIEIYLNDTTFISGDFTTSSPLLIVRLFDESGINTVGNGIGHEISAILDDYTQNPFILNDYYTPDPDSYKSGWVYYPFGNLEPGYHTLSLKAWDIYNNSSEATIAFVIDTVSSLKIYNAYNFPNPFREGTSFVFSHNKPGSNFEVMIDIYGLDGSYIQSLRYDFTSENLNSVSMPWDGRDSTGQPLSAGMYIYRLIVTADKSKQAVVSQKMILIH
jgi:hypothetical protein